MSVSRVLRVGELMREEIAGLMECGVKDPRLGFATVTEVRLSRDLCHARVFVSVLGSEKERDETLRALRSASGFIRRELGRRIRMRVTPELTFVWDPSMERGAHVAKLLKDARDSAESPGSDGPPGSDGAHGDDGIREG